MLVIALWFTTGCQPRQWGRLANPGFENQRIKTTVFFAGQARDGSQPYGCNPEPNLSLYTVHPVDDRHLNWSVSRENRDFALNEMVEAGINVVTMSSWGERFLPCDAGWAKSAPMQTAPQAHDELFEAAAGKPLLIMPLIESRGDEWSFYGEFPRRADGLVAPGTVSQITELIKRYLKNGHPEWADRWARVYDRNGEPRYAVVIIHASSDRLEFNEHERFAAGFDLVAEEIFKATGVKVGFFIDPLPPGTHAPGRFKPDPEATGPFLRRTNATLGIQCFIPEVWTELPDEAALIAWKRDFSRRWSETGIPFLMDVSPGYDAHLVFPKGHPPYGLNAAWQDALTKMVADFGQDGLVFNSWNGYTEGMAAVPTREHGDTFYRWLQRLNAAETTELEEIGLPYNGERGLLTKEQCFNHLGNVEPHAQTGEADVGEITLQSSVRTSGQGLDDGLQPSHRRGAKFLQRPLAIVRIRYPVDRLSPGCGDVFLMRIQQGGHRRDSRLVKCKFRYRRSAESLFSAVNDSSCYVPLSRPG